MMHWQLKDEVEVDFNFNNNYSRAVLCSSVVKVARVVDESTVRRARDVGGSSRSNVQALSLGTLRAH